MSHDGNRYASSKFKGLSSQIRKANECLGGYRSCRSFFCWQNKIIADIVRTFNLFVYKMNFQCICLRSDNNQSEISQRKHVISKTNKFNLEFKICLEMLTLKEKKYTTSFKTFMAKNKEARN